MNQYKKKVDGIHAPEDLITATLNRIHDEEKMQENAVASDSANIEATNAENGSGKIIRPRRWMAGLTAVAAAAVVVLAIGFSSGNSAQVELIYNTVPETLVRTVEGEETESGMSVEEYSTYTGIDFAGLTEDISLVKADVHVIQEAGTVLEDEATFTYNVAGEPVLIQCSKTKSVMPESLVGGQQSDVQGQQVCVAISENATEHMAYLEKGEMSYFLMSFRMETSEFEAFLLDILDKL